ncbi:MAG: carboxymuconolactone decarboxylase family protein [Thermoleophilia bacterium]|nr:carboxymuconolactone decarboxylase family protein [Thermoleophilia bacterium]
MARLPLAEENDLEGFPKEMHDGAADEDWATQHVARVFAAHPQFLEQYLTFYYPWHSNVEAAEDAAKLTPRMKELVRLRIAVLNGCVTCQSARLAPETVPEDQATGIWAEDFANNPEYSPAERVAVEFAEKMAVDHHSIGDDDIAVLREHFDEAATLELMMMAGQYIGFGRTLAILQLETVACPIPAS